MNTTKLCSICSQVLDEGAIPSVGVHYNCRTGTVAVRARVCVCVCVCVCVSVCVCVCV